MSSGHLPNRFCAHWAGQEAWRILDTDWHDGRLFLDCWDTWKRDPLRPRVLHFVALIEPGSAAHTHPDLAAHCQPLQAGFNRLSFSQGHVLLTLCIGERKPMLRAQNFAADSIVVNAGQSALWDDWTIQALLRCCRRGTQLIVRHLVPPHVAELHLDGELAQRFSKHGFEFQPGATAGGVHARFNPPWQIKSTRKQPLSPIQRPSHCVVIGAGLAGASTAASLARRGWQVMVLDAAVSPAKAASGLPVGLMVAPPQSEHNVRARLLRAGVTLTMDQAREHLCRGQDWAQTGVMFAKPGQAAHWEASAAWIKPQRLAQAWLAQPGIQFRGNACAVSMEKAGDEWIVRDAQNAVLAQGGLIVLACGGGAQTVAASLKIKLRQRMAGIHGQVSWAVQEAFDRRDLPAFPLNGHGHLLPDIPVGTGNAWFAGATYSATDGDARAAASSGHALNLSRLARLHPPSGQLMQKRIQEGTIQAWHGIRYTTADRMPLVGPLHLSPSSDRAALLCINSGFGSWGLSWSVLCAELLAGLVGNEPLPMPNAWTRLLRGLP